jgi:hypothetical protein
MKKLFLVLILFLFPVFEGCLLDSEDNSVYIYGYVINKLDYGVNAVTVSLISDGNIIATTSTNSYGYFEFNAIKNSTYTIIPTKTGFTFTPSSIDIVVKSEKKVEIQAFVGQT